ncbi:hypothetical protein ENUP19_0259G0020 [Entamoeba nuttalli]|uniref:CXXC-rich protein n=2 Tax=Entamoeba nuttalli TaxID=412467 RepID=A0ABQ0DS63_9EUKA
MSQFIILFFLLVVINAETCPEILSTCSSCSKDSDGNYVCSDCVSDCILINSSCIIPERGDEKCRCPSYSKVVDGVCVCNNNRYYDSAKGICQKCTNNNPQCSSCNETNGECTSCKNPYVLDEKTKLCVSACPDIPHCLECPSNSCTTCENKYEPKDNGASCGCASPYTEISGKCVKCSSVYSHCLDGNCDDTKCLKCNEANGFKMNERNECVCSPSTGYNFILDKCQPCRGDCDTCTENYAVCEGSCRGNASISNNCGCVGSTYHCNEHDCCECSILHSHCLYCDGVVCNQCDPEYVLENGVCKECQEVFPMCSYCRNGKCEECTDGYYKSEGSCHKCADHCLSCNEITCDLCQVGYYVNGNKCNPCLPHCMSCQNESFCNSCEDLYEWNTLKNECVLVGDDGFSNGSKESIVSIGLMIVAFLFI